MQLIISILITFFLLIQSIFCGAQNFSIGPVLHTYFGNKAVKNTIGIECAFYPAIRNNGLTPSIDFGYERGAGYRCFYYECQIAHVKVAESGGPAFIDGFSMGLCIINDGFKKSHAALQMNLWGGFFALGNIRFRFDKYGNMAGIGGMLKVPVPIAH